jgi:uncharacterized protein (DUF58 family)
MSIWKFYRSLYTGKGLFYVLIFIIILFVLAFFIPMLGIPARVCVLAAALAFTLDLVFLYWQKEPVLMQRKIPNRLSNGDDNEISLYVRSRLPFKISADIIDEIPAQFQVRDFNIKTSLQPTEERVFSYKLRPVTRGEYTFNRIHTFIQGPFRMACRRVSADAAETVPVYPSFIQMRYYEMLASSTHSENAGLKKIRRLGQHSEFENIRNYVRGDDYRSVNWKATARQNKLMVNQYQDERAQEVYSIIDMGRVMRMPFEGLTLLDYSINASLMISNIALMKYDKAGLLPFSTKADIFLPAEAQGRQMQKIMDCLYRLETSFLEPDYDLMYMAVRRYINRRSLLILFTNFESIVSLERRMDLLRKLAASHLVLVIFFENTEIRNLLTEKDYSIAGVYQSIIAENFLFEKKKIVKELNRNGVQAMLTSPQSLSINLLNKYLEFKAIGLI